MPESFLHLSNSDRSELLKVAESHFGRPANLLEKDVWIVQLLNVLFSSKYGSHLVFKGGTALSKVYKVIDRFSEDVDVTYDIRQIINVPANVVQELDVIPKTRSQQEKFTKLVRESLPSWVVNEIQPLILGALSGIPFETEITGKLSDCLVIKYPSVTAASEYVPATVRLDFGARSTGEPASARHIVCDIAEHFPDVSFPIAEPRTMEISRIFWEKSTAMHVYCLQGETLAHRFSRHLHDIARLRATGHVQEAVEARNVAVTVAEHKAKFFREKARDGSVIDYNAAIGGSLRLVPEGPALDAVQKDYALMISEGLLRDGAQGFEELIAECRQVEQQANTAAPASSPR
jgi:Nucleotidyl transferase AbiEii toxin, Type IV TA system